jgi:glycosyl transferase, family 25
MELLDLFDRVMIINAPHRTDRRLEMRQMLQRVGWDPDGPKLTWFPAIDPKTAVGFSSPGMRGCFLSHVNVLNIAAHLACKRLLVLEDDCEFSTDFGTRQGRVADALNTSPWGIAYLGHIEAVDGPTGLQRNFPPEKNVLLTHCYAVAGEVIPRLAGYLEAIPLRPPGSPDGGPMSPDGGISWFRRANPDVETVMAAPSLAGQRSSKSDLSPRWFDNVPFLAAAAAKARAIRKGVKTS